MITTTQEQDKALSDYLGAVLRYTVKCFRDLSEELPAPASEPTEQEYFVSVYLSSKHILKRVFPNSNDTEILEKLVTVYGNVPEVTPEQIRESNQQELETAQQIFLAAFNCKNSHGLFYNPMFSEIYSLNKQKLSYDTGTGEGKLKRAKKKYEVALTIDQLSKRGAMSSSMQKIFTVASMLLTESNFHKGGITRSKVELDVTEYAEKCGKKLTTDTLRENFVKYIHKDLYDIEAICWTGKEMKGELWKAHSTYRLISSHQYDKKRGKFVINFDTYTAELIQHSYAAIIPECLFKLDNKKHNSFALGYKLAIHNSIDRNNGKGTANTLRVSTVIDSLPEIMNYDEFQQTNRNDWRKQIKAKLEDAINDNKKIGYINRWEYRDSSGKRYTSKTASELSLDEYLNLLVDFALTEITGKAERAEKLQREKQQRTETETPPPKRKRGRPKKAPEKIPE